VHVLVLLVVLDNKLIQHKLDVFFVVLVSSLMIMDSVKNVQLVNILQLLVQHLVNHVVVVVKQIQIVLLV